MTSRPLKSSTTFSAVSLSVVRPSVSMNVLCVVTSDATTGTLVSYLTLLESR